MRCYRSPIKINVNVCTDEQLRARRKTDRFGRPSALLQEPHAAEQPALVRRHPRDLTADIDRPPRDRMCVPRRPHRPSRALDLFKRRVVRQTANNGLKRRRHRDAAGLGTIGMQVDDAFTCAEAAHAEKGEHPARVVAMPMREDDGFHVVHRRLHRGGVADDGFRVGSGIEEDEVFVLAIDLCFLSTRLKNAPGRRSCATYDQGGEPVSP